MTVWRGSPSSKRTRLMGPAFVASLASVAVPLFAAELPGALDTPDYVLNSQWIGAEPAVSNPRAAGLLTTWQLTDIRRFDSVIAEESVQIDDHGIEIFPSSKLLFKRDDGSAIAGFSRAVVALPAHRIPLREEAWLIERVQQSSDKPITIAEVTPIIFTSLDTPVLAHRLRGTRGGYVWVWIVEDDNGQIVAEYNAIFTADANVYSISPAEGAPRRVTLNNLTDPNSLTGRYVLTYLRDGTQVAPLTGNYLFTLGQRGFAESMVYYHLDKIHDFFSSSLGFQLLDDPNLSMTAYVGANAADDPLFPLNAGYFGQSAPTTNHPLLIFGAGGPDQNNRIRDFALDATVVAHEYTHAVVDFGTRNPGATIGITCPETVAYCDAGALHEGFADYFAAASLNEPRVGQWVGPALAIVTGDPAYNLGLRDLTGIVRAAKTFPVKPADLEVHVAGEYWGQLAWDLRTRLAPQTTLGRPSLGDELVLGAVTQLRQGSDTFAHAAAAILRADILKFQGIHYFDALKIINDHGLLIPSPANQPPQITLGTFSRTLRANQQLRLTYTYSDPNGDALAVAKWRIISQSPAGIATLSDPTTGNATLRATGQGAVTVGLQVGDDGFAVTNPADNRTTITIQGLNAVIDVPTIHALGGCSSQGSVDTSYILMLLITLLVLRVKRRPL